MEEIKTFYNSNKFPGTYSKESLEYHWPTIKNPYLKIIDTALTDNISIIDIGCGSGLISNLFAKKYPSSKFLGIDFSDSIDHAVKISQQLELKNLSFIKQDFINFNNEEQYDVVICQGVLHHIPDYKNAAIKLKKLVKPNGLLVLGVYHPLGKIVKKYFNIDYKSKVLHDDQELNPFETTFDYLTVAEMFSEFTLCRKYPSFFGSVTISSIFNYKNGELVTYVFQKN